MVALSASERRTGYDSRARPDFHNGVSKVFETSSVPLDARNEITIARALISDAMEREAGELVTDLRDALERAGRPLPV